MALFAGGRGFWQYVIMKKLAIVLGVLVGLGILL
jgi:hypothetical protein